MKTILVDDMPLDMKLLEVKCKGIEGIEIMGSFDDSGDALYYAAGHEVDCALLDIDMPGMNGIELACHLRKFCKDIIIVFVTAYSQFYLKAMNMESSFVVFKPIIQEEINAVMEKVKMKYNKQ